MREKGVVTVKLTDEMLEELFRERAIVTVQRNGITLKLSKESMKAVMSVLGEKERIKDWLLLN